MCKEKSTDTLIKSIMRSKHESKFKITKERERIVSHKTFPKSVASKSDSREDIHVTELTCGSLKSVEEIDHCDFVLNTDTSLKICLKIISSNIS